MFVAFSHSYIQSVIISFVFLHLIFVFLREKIRFPHGFLISVVGLHQRIVRRPPLTEKSAAFSFRNEFRQVVFCAQEKLAVQNSFCVQTVHISQCTLGLFCNRAIGNLSALSCYPFPRLCVKHGKNPIC